MSVTHVPVLIVGAGAGGLTTSALLAQHGVRSLLVEKRDEGFIYPKARNLSFRSLEILRELGLADEVHAVADGVSSMLGKPTLSSTEEWEAFDVDALFSPFEGPDPRACRQILPTERIGADVARAHSSAPQPGALWNRVVFVR